MNCNRKGMYVQGEKDIYRVTHLFENLCSVVLPIPLVPLSLKGFGKQLDTLFFNLKHPNLDLKRYKSPSTMQSVISARRPLPCDLTERP